MSQSKLEQAVTAVRDRFMKDQHSLTGTRDALRPFFEAPVPSVEVDLDLDERIDELCGDLEDFLFPGDMEIIRRAVARSFKAFAAELQPAPAGVSDETLLALAADLWDGNETSEEEVVATCRFHLQPKPKPKVWPKLARDGYPEPWTSVEEWVPRDGDNVLMAGNPPLSAPRLWSGLWPDPNATHWCRLKAGPSA